MNKSRFQHNLSNCRSVGYIHIYFPCLLTVATSTVVVSLWQPCQQASQPCPDFGLPDTIGSSSEVHWKFMLGTVYKVDITHKFVRLFIIVNVGFVGFEWGTRQT